MASISSMNGGVGAAVESGMRPRRRRNPGDFDDNDGRKQRQAPPDEKTPAGPTNVEKAAPDDQTSPSIKIHQHCTDDERTGLMLDLFV